MNSQQKPSLFDQRTRKGEPSRTENLWIITALLCHRKKLWLHPISASKGWVGSYSSLSSSGCNEMPQTSLHGTVMRGQEGSREFYPHWEVTSRFLSGYRWRPMGTWTSSPQWNNEVYPSRQGLHQKRSSRKSGLSPRSNKFTTHTPPLVSVKVMWEAGTRQSYPCQLGSFKGGLVKSQKSHPCPARMRRPLRCHWRSSEGPRFLLSSHSSKVPFLSRSV